jgi:hypothetical protein
LTRRQGGKAVFAAAPQGVSAVASHPRPLPRVPLREAWTFTWCEGLRRRLLYNADDAYEPGFNPFLIMVILRDEMGVRYVVINIKSLLFLKSCSSESFGALLWCKLLTLSDTAEVEQYPSNASTGPTHPAPLS